MINYDKIEDVVYYEIAENNKEEYARIFKYETPSVKEFCKKWLDGDISSNAWGKYKRLKKEYVKKELIPYLIRVGALVPSVKDPIKYALITVPAFNSVKLTKEYRGKKLTIEEIGETYFDKDANIIERGVHDLSNPNVSNMIQYYNYIKMCADCDQEWINKIETTLKAYGIISEQNVEGTTI